MKTKIKESEAPKTSHVLFDLGTEQKAREKQIDGVEFVSEEFFFQDPTTGESRPWRFIATDPDSQAVTRRFNRLVEIVKRGRHPYARKPGKKEQFGHQLLLLLRQQAYIETSIHLFEFGFLVEGAHHHYHASSSDADAKSVMEKLVEVLWTTKIEVGSQLISDIADEVREATAEEDRNREKD